MINLFTQIIHIIEMTQQRWIKRIHSDPMFIIPMQSNEIQLNPEGSDGIQRETQINEINPKWNSQTELAPDGTKQTLHAGKIYTIASGGTLCLVGVFVLQTLKSMLFTLSTFFLGIISKGKILIFKTN